MPLPDLATLLDECASIHGHVCAGQVLGIRMALLGLRLVGVRDPRGADRKALYLIVEIDRCATDALQTVTGCSLGRRTLRFVDHGKLAATFVNLRTGRAVRLVARDDARAQAAGTVRDMPVSANAQVECYKVMPESALFDVREVEVAIAPQDLPGKPLRRIRCHGCGESVQDMREVYRDGTPLCRPCVEGRAYYRVAGDPPMSKSHAVSPHYSRIEPANNAG